MNNSDKKRLCVVMAAYKNSAVLDITGPAEVFAAANHVLAQSGREPAYDFHILAENGGRCETMSSVSIYAECAWQDFNGEIDTLMVTGGDYSQVYKNEAFLSWLNEKSKTARRTASVCTGAFILAEAGLLKGRKATTHWMCAELLAKEYPEALVEADSIYTSDGGIYTSAGITAGMDLSLAFVAEDFGRQTALDTARMLVLYLKRPGGQSQFSSRLKSQKCDGSRLWPLLNWIGENHMKKITSESLADKANMSHRTFLRVFSAETGTTPAKYVENLRIEHAVQLLSDSVLSIKEITDRCGFGSPDAFRRIFQNFYGVTPQDFRERFGR